MSNSKWPNSRKALMIFPLMWFFILHFSIDCVTFAMRAFGMFCSEWLTADGSDVAWPFTRTLYWRIVLLCKIIQFLAGWPSFPRPSPRSRPYHSIEMEKNLLMSQNWPAPDNEIRAAKLKPRESIVMFLRPAPAVRYLEQIKNLRSMSDEIPFSSYFDI